MESSPELFDVKNNFYLGNFQGAINEANSIPKLKEADKLERDIYVYRSYVAQGKYNIVLEEIKESSNPALQPVRILATYLSKEESRDMCLSKIKEWMGDGVIAGNPHLQIIAATIFSHEQNFEEAMRSVYQNNTLEGIAILIQIYLKINRVDQAEKELKRLQQTDDDATLSQLASAWVSIAVGGDRVQEAITTLQELIDKYGPTCYLLNALGACHLQSKRFSEAEKLLLQALEKNSNDIDTLINLISCYQQASKPTEVIQRTLTQLRSIAPKHPWVKSFQKMEEDFDKFQGFFASSA